MYIVDFSTFSVFAMDSGPQAWQTAKNTHRTCAFFAVLMYVFPKCAAFRASLFLSSFQVAGLIYRKIILTEPCAVWYITCNRAAPLVEDGRPSQSKCLKEAPRLELRVWRYFFLKKSLTTSITATSNINNAIVSSIPLSEEQPLPPFCIRWWYAILTILSTQVLSLRPRVPCSARRRSLG